MLVITLLINWLSINYSLNETIMKWVLLPTLGYAIAIGLNAFIQYISCGTINSSQIALGSLSVLFSILFFLLLSSLGFIRAPIQSAVPLSLQVKYGYAIALGYYMFWAGMFGEAIAGGVAQSCNTAADTTADTTTS
jgi:hypothetical protein